jgi:hypothetical protein
MDAFQARGALALLKYRSNIVNDTDACEIVAKIEASPNFST